MVSLPRRMLAEAIGTFALVFFGCASVVMAPGANYGVLGVAIAHALALSVAVTATMAISGGNLNPAVTLGLLVGRRLDAKSAVGYIVAQLIGAVVAAYLLSAIFPSNLGRNVSWGTPLIANNTTLATAILLEAVMTFFLMSAVYGTAVSPEAPRVGGFAIGLTLVFCILAGGPLTGAALNPARAFGPAVISKVWAGHIAYWIGPITGAVVGALVWEYGLLRKREAAA